MKKSLLLTILCVIIATVVIFKGLSSTVVDTRFATNAYIRFICFESNEITSVPVPNYHLSALKTMLHTRSFQGSPACGFSSNTSIVLVGNDHNVVFSPALDGCSILRVKLNGNYRFITIDDADRAFINMLFEAHGIVFPFI